VYHEIGVCLYMQRDLLPAADEQGIAMNVDKDRLRYVFAGDYPESYGPAELTRLRAIRLRQVGQLAGADPAEQDKLLRLLIARRSADPNRAQLDVRTGRDGVQALVAKGEVVLAADAYKAVSPELDGYTRLSGESGAFVRLRRADSAAADVPATIIACAGADTAAWMNAIATMAAVGKGIGGPEPVDPPPPPPPPPFTALLPGAAPVRVAVIDTGITAQTRDDGILNAVPRTQGNVDALDLLPAPDGYLDYGAGHGTFVAGIIARVAPKAQIVMYRAADSDGFATDSDIAEAVLQAYAEGAQIINISLGLRTTDGQPPPALAGAVEAVREQSAGQAVIVAAAGNYGDTVHVYPAALDGVEAVAGLTAQLQPAAWSSHGDVQFSAVAEGIRSTFVKGTESPDFDKDPDTFGSNAWAIWSGTSFAAPQVAGAVARMSYEENIGARAAAGRLAAAGTPIPGYGAATPILSGIG
jgi:hypothetical protein